VVVFDDSAWSTIKRSTRGSHPDGAAVRTGNFALCDFAVSPKFDEVARAFGAVGLRVDRPSEVPAVLAEALRLVREERRHVLVDVVCERDG
jgi:acetolactate synthase-1/2/3 large subunit